MRETDRGRIPRNDGRVSAGTWSSLPSSTKSWISPSRRGAWCSAVGRAGEFGRREGRRRGLVKRVGTRDGSALRLVSGSVRRPGSSIRAEMKEKEQTHTMWTHLIAVGLGRRKEFKRILFLGSVRESLNT
jgi:hypothetical protein